MTLLQPRLADLPLSAAMREGSQAEHDRAESSGFMSELLGGRLNERAYADYLLRLRVVYAALETTGRTLDGHPAVDAVLDPALERLAAIDVDLAHWAPGEVGVESRAAAAYGSRIDATVAWAPLFVAHHYTRYLGDLSGGQAIGRVLDRTFDLSGAGLSFYTFAAIPKPKPYKDSYRTALDGIDLDECDRARVVDEVRVAFDLNQALFAELGENLAAYRR